MPPYSYETWQSIWAPLLTEAVERACTKERGSQRFAHLATSIILAKASWEAFQNEFIESRYLPPVIKTKTFTNALVAICNALEIKEINFQTGTIWEALLCVSKLRNAIVHHSAQPLKPGEAPSGLIRLLQNHGLVDASSPTASHWESLLVTPKTAAWACTVVGKAILELERVPNRRRRSPALVEERVFEALNLLSQEAYSNTHG